MRHFTGFLNRSLGLSLLECVTGRYPYDASAGPLQLMIQVRRPARQIQDMQTTWTTNMS